MIIEARDDVVTLEGSLDKNLWLTIQAAANLLLRHHTQGIIVDGSGLTRCAPEGALTFRDAMDYIERYRARIVVCGLPEPVMEVVRAVPGIRSRLPVTATVEEARASLQLARARITGSTSERGGRTLQDIFVPLLRAEGSEQATRLACRLAKAEGQKTRIHLAYFLEVPRDLPLTAPLPEDESRAAQTLKTAETLVQKFGLTAVVHVLRTRDTAEEIVQRAAGVQANIIVMSTAADDEPIREFFTRIARVVLDRAPCEVIVNKLAPAR